MTNPRRGESLVAPRSPSQRGPDRTAVPDPRHCRRPGGRPGLLGLRLRRPAGPGRGLDAGGRDVPLRARLRGPQRDCAQRRPAGPDRVAHPADAAAGGGLQPDRPAQPRPPGSAGPQGLVALGHADRAGGDRDPARTRRHRHRRARLRLGIDQHRLPVAAERRPGGWHVDPHRLRRRHGGWRAAGPARPARHRRMDPVRRCAVRLPPRPVELPALGDGEVSHHQCVRVPLRKRGALERHRALPGGGLVRPGAGRRRSPGPARHLERGGAAEHRWAGHRRGARDCLERGRTDSGSSPRSRCLSPPASTACSPSE